MSIASTANFEKQRSKLQPAKHGDIERRKHDGADQPVFFTRNLPASPSPRMNAGMLVSIIPSVVPMTTR